ncbi:MAG: glutamine-hydrolyzing GMP synthase [Microscillaceae bacterium]|nr:glutamine-hydrolyzing GMP synthase [Microscillaceae bacterium]MDW8461063.1 glutamine-hydrolyzing GMP synthase [Cytophagales bacterium]
MANVQILILDFGSQYTQLIARRIREMNVYCEIVPFDAISDIPSHVKGVILSGSPYSVHDKDAPDIFSSFLEGKVPLLGICYGAQLLVYKNRGVVEPSSQREYGRANLININHDSILFNGIPENAQVWMSHGDTITTLPSWFEVLASTQNIPIAAFKERDKDVYGLQFHPEVTHSTEGTQILRNFVLDICECEPDWTPAYFIQDTVKELQRKIGQDKVVLGLSGGVDSSVAAMLLHKAIGKNLYCLFIDNGLLRKNEFAEVLHSYQDLGLNVIGIDAKQTFYEALDGITDPEQKRKAIGRTFIEVFEQEARKIKDVKWLAQGTIYPDVIESMSVKGPSATIKSHHNVGGLPEKMNLKIVEPLRMLFKDEVRKVGKELQLPEHILNRHPFPGPGLAIRILGEIAPEKIMMLQEADAIFIENLKQAGWYNQVWQAGAILINAQSVGVMGDERTYEQVIALRAVTSTDGMTADWVRLPYELLAKISNDIINKVRGVNRVVYDISSKPPATIEWE